MEYHEFEKIIEQLTQLHGDIVEDKNNSIRDLQKRLDVLEEILHSYLPIIEKKEDKDDGKGGGD